MSILKFLGIEPAPERELTAAPETETVRKIVDALDRMDPAQARYVAAFAYILSRVAHADRRISDEETRAMEQIVIRHGGLSEQQALIVVQMAKTQSKLFGGTEDFLVTREFNQMADQEQKIGLLHCLFSVSSADRSISTVEANEISRIATQLHLSHADYVAVRSHYREHLEVLKGSS